MGRSYLGRSAIHLISGLTRESYTTREHLGRSAEANVQESDDTCLPGGQAGLSAHHVVMTFGYSLDEMPRSSKMVSLPEHDQSDLTQTLRCS